MLAQHWPGVDWFTADDRLIATAIELLETQHDQIEEMEG